MRASVMFDYEGQSWRCLWIIFVGRFFLDEVIGPQGDGLMQVRADYAKLPRPGQYCKRPHKYLASHKEK